MRKWKRLDHLLRKQQKSIEENICFAFCLTGDFYRFCWPYVLQEQKKKRVKIRLNRRQFRWIFVDWLKSKIKKKKKRKKKKEKDSKKCGSNFCGEGNIGQNSLTKRTNFAPNFEIPDVQLHRSNVFINLDLTKIPGCGDGDSRMKVTGMLVGKFKLNP